MKKFLLILALLCGLTAKAQTLPFVQEGKNWHVLAFSMGGNYQHTPKVTDYFFDGTKKTAKGKTYLGLYARTDGEATLKGWFRGYGGRVYRYMENKQKECLVYDFTLQEGDPIDFADEDGNMLHGVVAKVENKEVNGTRLKTITLDLAVGEEQGVSGTTTWTDGVGTNGDPSCPVAYNTPNSWTYVTAYVLFQHGLFLPFSFNLPHNWWRGQQLKLGEEHAGVEGTDDLHYELVDGMLHVHGTMWTSCSPNQYIYCVETNWDMGLDRGELQFRIDELEPQADCQGSHKVELYFPFLNHGTYVITDRAGQHTVYARQYQPLVENGKRWCFIKDWTAGDNDIDSYFNYYVEYLIDGDTVINNQKYKKLYCGKTDPSKPNLDNNLTLRYYAALREVDGVVYCLTDRERVLYDFSMQAGEDRYIWIDGRFYWATNVEQQEFEGQDRRVWTLEPDEGPIFTWIEGIGNPLELMQHEAKTLVWCKLGDKILYHNPKYPMEKEESIPPLFSNEMPSYWNIYSWNKEQKEQIVVVYETDFHQRPTFEGKEYRVIGIAGQSKRFYYRQDSRQLYRYDESQQKEELMMDFDLKEGEVFTRPDGVRLKVESVGDTLLYHYSYGFKVPCRMLKLRDVDDATLQDTWIETMGSLTSGILLPTDLENYTLKQVMKFAGFTTSMWWVNSPTFRTGNVNVGDEVDVPPMTPVADSLHYEFVGDTLHITGVLTLNCFHDYYYICHIDGINVGITYDMSSTLAATCNSAYNVEFIIPGFTPGTTYTVSVNNRFTATITCPDASAIPPVARDTDQPKGHPQLFDLKGRPVTTRPTRGIYIKDGKKYYTK